MPGEDLSPIVLIDRAGLGGLEVWHDGRPFVFPKGETELVGTVDLARHVFVNDKAKTWTKVACPKHSAEAMPDVCLDCRGPFVHRLALRDAPGYRGLAKQIAATAGDEILDQSPIEIWTTRIEGWGLEGVAPGARVAVNVNVPPSDFRDRLGNARPLSVLQER